MSQPLSDQTIALVKATVPALEAHGLDIVHEMYSRMFQNPDIRDLFNQSHHGDAGSQPRALTGAILAYASNIDNLGALAPAVERIAQKHVGLQILPEHYPHVAEALLGAIKAVLGDAAHGMPPYLAQGAGHAMMNALGLAVALEAAPDLAGGLTTWERRERPLTEHTQRWTQIYGLTLGLPKALKPILIGMEQHLPWLAAQYVRAANHVPTGCVPVTRY